MEQFKEYDEFVPFTRFYCYVLTDNNYIKLANFIIDVKKYSFQDLLNHFLEFCDGTNYRLVGIASKKYNYEYYEKMLKDNGYQFDVTIEKCKPYLFPMSSMTEEQRKEYDKIIYKSIELHHREYSDIVEIDLFDDL